jgi:GntR family transcriptional regulator
MRLDPLPAQSDPLPLYHRVYLLLRQRITEGGFAQDAPMPGEHELAANHGVSRITVRRALERLEQEGLVVRRRGAGTFARTPMPSPQRENLRGLIENLLAMGLRTQVTLVHFAYLPVPPDIAAALEIPAGTLAQKSVRVRSVPGANMPFSHLTAWVPEAIGRRYGPRDLAARPLLHLLEEAGEPAARAEQVISARLADAHVAPLLGVEQGSALLWVRRQVRDAEGRVIEAIEALYRPELYEYALGMVREDGLWSPAQRPR